MWFGRTTGGDYVIVDVDSHQVETDSRYEILDYIEDPVLRYNARTMTGEPAYLPSAGGMQFQDVFGRIPHQQKLAEFVDAGGVHRDVTLVRRAVDSIGVNVQVVFLAEHVLAASTRSWRSAVFRWRCTPDQRDRERARLDPMMMQRLENGLM